MTVCLQLISNVYCISYLYGHGCVFVLLRSWKLEVIAYLRAGVQVMSACLVDVSVADRVTVVLWLSVCESDSCMQS